MVTRGSWRRLAGFRQASLFPHGYVPMVFFPGARRGGKHIITIRKRRMSFRVPLPAGDLLPGGVSLAATLHWPEKQIHPGTPVLFMFPGAGYARGYFDIRLDGFEDYSEAEHHVGQGLIVAAMDHLGTGDSSLPDDEALMMPLGKELGPRFDTRGTFSLQMMAAACNAGARAVIDGFALRHASFGNTCNAGRTGHRHRPIHGWPHRRHRPGGARYFRRNWSARQQFHPDPAQVAAGTPVSRPETPKGKFSCGALRRIRTWWRRFTGLMSRLLWSRLTWIPLSQHLGGAAQYPVAQGGSWSPQLWHAKPRQCAHRCSWLMARTM